MNHRVDVKLMREMAKEFGRLFDLTGITAVLTVEASGIALATICAEEFGVPMILPKRPRATISKAACTKARYSPIHIKRK